MAIHPQCHLIVVMGGKGGVGKSVFAANLAFAFSLELKQPTLLLDLDQQSCGDQNVLTGLKPLKTLAEICTYQGSITAQNLFQHVTKHPTAILGYVAAVQRPDETFQVPTELATKQIDALSQHFRFIIADIGSQVGQLQLNMIEQSSGVLVVAVPEILSINQTQRAINDLIAATVPQDLFQLVLNKVSPTGMNPQTISQSLKRPLMGLIPQDDVTVAGSVQRSQPFVITAAKTPIAAAHHEVVRKLTGGVLQKLKSASRPSGIQAAAKTENIEVVKDASGSQKLGMNRQRELDPRTLLKMKTHTELIVALDLKKGITDTQGDPTKEKALRQKTQQVISQIVDKEGGGLSRDDRARVIKEVLDEALGLGPLEDLLADPTITEIMVNGCDRIFVEKSGKIVLSPVTFTSNQQLRNVIERIVTPLGRRIDEKTPYVDARLLDGSRVNAVIEPLSIDGPALTIRKFAKKAIVPDDYVHWGSMTKSMIDFLKICVENGLNVIISGGTGSGKTTLLNVLSSFIPANERIITVEDAAELQLKQEHVVRLETRPPNMEGTGAVTIRDLIRNSLRMRPDRIVVGECRDGAALDMLSAMNTGHDGSMATIHANSPREAVARLETLCLMAGMDLPVQAIREQIAGAVDLFVQISRLSDGSRKIISLTEVIGMQGDKITLQEIFRFKEEGFDKNRKIIGAFQATGMIPTFIEDFEAKGVAIPRSLFSNTQPGSTKPAGGGNNTPPAGGGAGSGPAAASNTATPTNQAQSPVKKASGSGFGGSR
jgi:pilus assembly protein CpaF